MKQWARWKYPRRRFCHTAGLRQMENFALILFGVAAVTGGLRLPTHYFSKRGRKDDKNTWWIEYPRASSRDLIVFLLRSFWSKPFKDSLGLRWSDLVVGDFILVNKFLRIRIPLINKRHQCRGPSEANVMSSVSEDPSLDYIKAVVAFQRQDRIREQEALHQRVAQPRKQIPTIQSRRIHYSTQSSRR